MDYRDLRIIFIGTPGFAVASLDALVKAGCNIVGVITAPDKPAGRGLKLQESAVKRIKRLTAGEIKELPIFRRASIIERRFTNCSCI